MADMPERVWVGDNAVGAGASAFAAVLVADERTNVYGRTEYVRADLLAARDAEIAALKERLARVESFESPNWMSKKETPDGG